MLSVIFVQGWFPRWVPRFLRIFFGFDTTYTDQPVKRKPANLKYMAVYYRVLPLSMLGVSKSYEIPYHLANSWENFVSRMMCISTCRSWPLPELKQMMKGVCMETHCCCWCKNTCSYISLWSIQSGTNLKKNSCHWKTN